MASQAVPQAPRAPTGDELRRLTFALRQANTATSAAEALAGVTDRGAVEGLVELLHAPPSADAAIAAVEALADCDRSLVRDGLRAALKTSFTSLHVVALEALRRRDADEATDDVEVLLRQSSAWIARRAAVKFLAERKGPQCWNILAAADDPHWRVRHALLQVLLAWSKDEARRPEIEARLAALPGPRPEGLRSYLHYRWTGQPPGATQEESAPAWPFWDWDAAVLARNLERLGSPGRRAALGAMPELLGHSDERVRASASDVLRAWGDAPTLARVLLLLDEPRSEGAAAALALLGGIELDRIEETARLILHLAAPSPASLAWALDRAGDAFPCEEETGALSDWLSKAATQPPIVRRALARLAGRWDEAPAEHLHRFLDDGDTEVQREAFGALLTKGQGLLSVEHLRRAASSPSPRLRAAAAEAVVYCEGLGDAIEALSRDAELVVRVRLAEALTRNRAGPEVLVRLQQDMHPHGRATALTADRAADLVRSPEKETSWHVLAAAARLAKVPLWKLAPTQPWQAPATPRPDLAPFDLHQPAALPHARPLGGGRLVVAPLGVSGHYGLPEEGFARAVEAGVNLLFWEPGYLTLARFGAGLAASQRRSLLFLAGTFEADGKRVRRDVERALRHLQIEQLAIFLIFWVQSWARLTQDVREVLVRLQEEGKVAITGISTHSRPLAVKALQEGWGQVMVRHSAAHRGAEKEVFPEAARLGATLLTFSSTCYGRLLQPRAGLTPPTAADCYRYTLEQPSVSACFCAPATLEQLDEDLGVLEDIRLTEERRAVLVAQGGSLYEDEGVFRRLIRSR
jgi:hypothetical protein